MNEINSFTFYRNYYDLLDNLPTEDKRLMLEVIVDYIFRDVEPIGLVKMNLAIWNNIKMPLETTKRNILNGKKGGRPRQEENPNENTDNNPNKNPNQNPDNNPKPNPKAKQNNISTFLFLISNFNYLQDKGLLREKIEEWLKYKWERKEYYKETGFKSLLAKLEKATNQYGVERIINLIDECMANNYKGIIFEKLEKQRKVLAHKEELPEWFDKDLKNEEMSKEDATEFDKLVSDITESVKNINDN